MADLRKHTSVSNIERFILRHSTTGAKLTGLSSASSGLVISTVADNEAAATSYTVAGSTIETITTLGTYAAPTATKCRFKEVDATNHPGLYEFQFANARYSVASARKLIITASGATNLLSQDYEIQLVAFDPYDAVRLGLTALPNAAADAAGGLVVSDAGGLDIDNMVVDLNADQSGVTIGTVNNVTGLVAGSGGISVAAEDFVVVTGTEIGGSTYADTRSKNGVYHIFDPAGGITNGYYVFDVTNAGVPQTIKLIYYAQSNGDSYTYSAYNWGTTTFEPVETVNASNGTAEASVTLALLIDHVGTGADAGKVRLQVDSTTGTRHAVDRAYCTYTVATSGIPNGSTITLAADATNQNFIGNSWGFVLAGYAVSGSYVSGAKSISGIGTIANGNPLRIQDSVMSACTLSAYAIIANTYLPDTLTLVSTVGGATDHVRINNSMSGVEGSGASDIDASGVTKATGIANRLYGGGISYTINSFCTLSHETVVGGTVTLINAGGAAEIRGAAVKALVLTSSGAAVTNFVCSSGAPITVNGTGGTLNVYGLHGGITDNSGATVTINDLGADVTDIPVMAADVANIDGAAMRGTDGANTVTPPTAAAIVDEWETQSQANPSGFHVNLMEIDSNANIMRKLKEFVDANVLFSDTAQAGGASTITLAAGTSVIDDDLQDYAIYLNGGLGAGQFARIESVVAATQVATIVTPANGWQTTPDVTTTYVILSVGSIIHVSDIHDGALASITAELDNNSTFASEVTGIQADLDNPTDGLGALKTLIDAVKAETVLIVEDTNELQTDWTDGGRLGLILDAINAATGTTGVVLTAAERNAVADAMLDRDISVGTDSGSATVRTIRQALRSNRNKVVIAGGVMTVYKEDDTTVAWTAAITTTAGDPISALDPAG